MSKRAKTRHYVRSAMLSTSLSCLILAAPDLAAAQEVLPRPEQPFKGSIGRTAEGFHQGFSAGGEGAGRRTERPAHPHRRRRLRCVLARSADRSRRRPWTGWPRTGCSYNQFHTTALCSPTRAALITGRNHHSAATGVIMEAGTGFPGYNTLMPKSCGTSPRSCKQNGYNTSWFGKNHNVPDWQTQPGRAVRPVADGAGLRILLRLHRRRHEPVGVPPSSRAPSRSSRRTTTRTTLRPGHGRQGHRLDPACNRPSRRTSRSSSTTPRAPRTPRTTRPRSGSRSSRASSTRAGTRQREETFEQPEEARRDPGRRQAHAAPQGNPGVGLASTPTRRRSSPT